MMRVIDGPDLGVSVRAVPPAVVVGGVVGFEAVITNHSDTKPASDVSLAASIVDDSGGYVTVARLACVGCSIPTLPPGATAVASLTAAVARTRGTGAAPLDAAAVTAWVNVSSSLADPVPANNEGAATATVYLVSSCVPHVCGP